MEPESTLTIGRAYGLNLESQLDFRSRLAPAEGPPDLRLGLARAGTVSAREDCGEPTYVSRFLDGRGESVLRIYRTGSGDLLEFPGVAEFVVGSDRIEVRSLDPALRHLLEIRFFGTVLAFWMEREGILSLHASSVEVRGGAVMFLSGKQSGKTSLACAFLQAGDRLLADDIVAIDVTREGVSARSAHPNIRLWPDEADHFLGVAAAFPRYHPQAEKLLVPVGESGFGRFQVDPRPVARIYLAERRPPGDSRPVEIRRLRPAAAAMELVRHSFAGKMVETLGWQGDRLDRMAAVVRSVSVRHLAYPSGLERLPAVREAVLADLESTP